MTAAQKCAQLGEIATVRLDVDDAPRVDAASHFLIARLDDRVAADDGERNGALEINYGNRNKSPFG